MWTIIGHMQQQQQQQQQQLTINEEV